MSTHHVGAARRQSTEKTQLINKQIDNTTTSGWKALVKPILGIAQSFFSWLGCFSVGKESIDRDWDRLSDSTEEGLPAAFYADIADLEVGVGEACAVSGVPTIEVKEVISDVRKIKEQVVPTVQRAIKEGKQLVIFSFEDIGGNKKVIIDIKTKQIHIPSGFPKGYERKLNELKGLMFQDREGLLGEVRDLHRDLLRMVRRSGNPAGRNIPEITDDMTTEELGRLRDELTNLQELIPLDQSFNSDMGALRRMLSSSYEELKDAKPRFVEASKVALSRFDEANKERLGELKEQIGNLKEARQQVVEQNERFEAHLENPPQNSAEMRKELARLHAERKELQSSSPVLENTRKWVGVLKETTADKLEKVEREIRELTNKLGDHEDYMRSIPERIAANKEKLTIIDRELQPLHDEEGKIYERRGEQVISNMKNVKKFDEFMERIVAFESELSELEGASSPIREKVKTFSEGLGSVDHRATLLLNNDVKTLLRDYEGLSQEHVYDPTRLDSTSIETRAS